MYFVLDNEAQISRILAQYNAKRIVQLFADPIYASHLLTVPGTIPEMKHFVQYAGSLPKNRESQLQREDLTLHHRVGKLFRNRQPFDTDSRTFISDRLAYINSVLYPETSTPQTTIGAVVEYALMAGGKRLRPALTLMLAEGLGIKSKTVEPLLKSIEYFHTASLVLDDLPAQDNARLRRGKPAVHIQFGEDRAQLAVIALIASGFGELEKLTKFYPAHKVTKVVAYLGSALAERLCLGQDMDLAMARSQTPVLGEDIIKMYALKTSTMIEASLVPTMILANRSDREINDIKEFAYHAGIVFQLRDDVLDATATAEDIGKTTQNDAQKLNIVQVFGLSTAESRIEYHHTQALLACQRLSFDTSLLQGLVRHFAIRRK